MNSDSEKLNILRENNFKYILDRELYVNREMKKIFSREAIEDNDVQWLSDKISERNINDIMIYFNGPVTNEIREELIRVFNF